MINAAILRRSDLRRHVLVLTGVAALLFALLPGAAQADHAEVDDSGGLVTSVRWNGADRYDTAGKLAVEGTAAQIATPATAAILATGTNFPDALAGSYLSGVVGGPILLTERDAIPAATLERLTGQTDAALIAVNTVYLLGGPVAISAAVEDQLAQLGYDVVRLSGPDRESTAATIATEAPEGTVGTIDGLRTAIIATQGNFPDALVAGAAARNGSLPLLLTRVDEVPSVTLDALAELEIQQVLIAGGPVAVGPAAAAQLGDAGYQVRRIAGENRDATAVAFARFNVDELDFTTDEIGLARNDDFPDALSFAPFAGREGLSITLTAPDALSPDTAAYLTEIASCQFDTLYIPGGPVAISDATEQAARTALTASGCDGIDNEGPSLASSRIISLGSSDDTAARSEPGDSDDGVQLTYDESVRCTDDVPGQFVHVAGDGTETPATSLRCNSSSRVLVGFPGGTIDPDDGDATITYTKAGNPDWRVTDLFGNDATNNDSIPVGDLVVPAERLTVNSTDDADDATPGDGVCETTVADQCTLRAAISEANSDADLTQIDVPAGTYVISRDGRGEDGNATGDLDITEDLLLVADGEVTVDANGLDRVFDVLGADVEISGFAVEDGNASGSTERGGGLRLDADSTVTITASVFGDNRAGQAGGAIENTGGTLTTMDTDFTGNRTGTTPGNGGAVHAAGGDTTISGGTASGNSAVEGGAHWIGGGGTMTVTGATVDGNTATGGDATAGARQGGGGLFNDGATLTIVASIISGNTATTGAGSGGGVMTTGESGVVSINGTQILNNAADRAGGGVENDGSTLVLGDVTRNIIDNNTATGENSAGNGGGVHATGPTTSTDDLVSANTAVEGGGLWIGGGATLTLNDSVVTENIAVAEELGQGGGGVYVDGEGAVLDANGAAITVNTATGVDESTGGGILVLDGAADLFETIVDGNTATRAGGGIEITGALGDGVVFIADSELTNNSVTGPPGNGGGLHVSSAELVSLSNSLVDGNVAASEGGGLWNNAGTSMFVTNGSTVSDNEAQGDDPTEGGGGIFNNGGDLTVTDSTIGAAAGVARDTTVGNRATGASGSGGGIFSTDGEVTVTSTDLRDNVANRAGGGIEVVEGSLVVDAGSELVRNVAGPGDSAAPGNGGGVHVSGAASTSFDDVVVRDNVAAREGGGLWNSGTGTMTVRESQILGNDAAGDAADDGGGGIFNDGGVVTIEDTDLGTVLERNGGSTGNIASGENGSGGAVQSLGGTLNIESSRFTDNSAHRAGGAIEAVDTDVNIDQIGGTSSQFNGNTATGAGTAAGNGGAIHQLNGTVDIGRGVFGVNSAVEGGAVWVGGTGTMTVTGTSDSNTGFIQNSALGGGNEAGQRQGGGAAYVDGALATLDVSFASFNGNTAVEDGASGGAILVNAGDATIADSTLSDNFADRAGGAIEVDLGSLVVTDSTFTFNRAEGLGGPGAPGNGGAIHNGSGSVTVTNTSASANRAFQGGAYWTNSGFTINGDFADNTIRDNVAQEGGAFYNTVAPLDATIGDFTFINVDAENGGHEVVDHLATPLVSKVAGDVQGNVYAVGAAGPVATATNSTFTDVAYEDDGQEDTCEVRVDDENAGLPAANTDDDGTCFRDLGAGTPGVIVVDTADDAPDATPGDTTCDTAAGDCSLRAAVQTAENTAGADTIRFSTNGPVVLDIEPVEVRNATVSSGDLDTTTDITVDGQDVITIDANALNDRVFDTTGGTLTLLDLTVTGGAAPLDDGGTTDRGGAARVTGAGTLVVDGVTFVDNSAPEAGGALENGGATLTVANATFTDNSTGTDGQAGNGGAVHAAGGTTTVTDSVATGNTAVQGGAYWVGGNAGDMTVTRGTVDGNTAEFGGGLYNSGAQGATLTVDGTDVGTVGGGNTATGSTTATASSGGGLTVFGGTTTITDATFTANTAPRAGGAIEVAGSGGSAVVTITDTDFVGNTSPGDDTIAGAPGNGGAIHVSDADTVTINNGTVDGNVAASEGGGFWNQTGTMDVNGTVFVNNDAQGASSTEGGGALFNNSGVMAVDGATIGTDSGANSASGVSGSGGGIMTVGGTLFLDNSDVVNNTANRAGGGVEVGAGAGTTILGFGGPNTVSGNNAGINPGNGGGLHTTNAPATVIGGTVSGNTAVEGGGLWNGTARLGVVGTTVTGNTAIGAIAEEGGGGLFNNGGELDVDNASITSNSSTGVNGAGGGIHSRGGTVTVDNTPVDGNTSVRFGGGIHATGGTVTVTGGQVSGNTAVFGGGIHNDEATLTVQNGTVVSQNTATGPGGSGGGILVSDNGTGVHTTTLDGITIEDNSADRAGGGLEVTGAPNSANGGTTGAADVSLTNVDFTSNVADGDGSQPGNGGAIHVTTAATVSVTGGIVDGNTAAREGGGFWNQDGGMTVDGTVFTNNVASGAAADDGGGALFQQLDPDPTPANRTGSLTVQNSTVGTSGNGNTAIEGSGSGGGVQALGGTLDVTNTTFTGNVANRAGGAIESADTTTTVVDSTFTTNVVNTNPGNGGAIHGGGTGQITVMDTNMTGNTAGNEGGALWASAGTVMSVSGGSYDDNTAPIGGAFFNDNGSMTFADVVATAATSGATVAGGGHVFASDAGTVDTTAGGNVFTSPVDGGPTCMPAPIGLVANGNTDDDGTCFS